MLQRLVAVDTKYNLISQQHVTQLNRSRCEPVSKSGFTEFAELKNSPPYWKFLLLNLDNPVNPDSDNPCNFINKIFYLELRLTYCK